MAISLDWLKSIREVDATREPNEGEILTNTATGDVSMWANNTLRAVPSTTGYWDVPAGTNAGYIDNAELTMNSDGTGITYTSTYTTDHAPISGDILMASGTGNLTYSPSMWTINKYTLFTNDYLYINEHGEVYVEGKRETNTTKIGLALIRAINKSKDNETIDSMDDL